MPVGGPRSVSPGRSQPPPSSPSPSPPPPAWSRPKQSSAATGRTVTSAGDPRVEIGAAFEGDLATAQGDLRFRATQNSTRRTPLTPHDAVALEATIVHPDGTRYEVAATIAMVNEPTGRFTTWGGIGFDKWHHGRSGIGTAEIDPTRSEVAIYGIADVRADGEVVASGVPVHAMTVDGAGVELHVGDAASPVPGLPDGHLRVVWDGRSGDSPEGPERARHLLGGTVLLLLIGAALVALRSASGARRS